jgi:aminopeptidase N
MNLFTKYLIIVFAFWGSNNLLAHVEQDSTNKKKQTVEKTIKYRPNLVFDLIHTDLNLKPLWQTRQMEGEATLTMKPYYYNQSKVVLDAKNFDIHKVQLIEKKSVKELTYVYDSLKLTINLPKEYSKKDTLKLYIKYTANPERIKQVKGKAIKSDKGLYFINTEHKRKGVPMQLWTQGETQANSGWFPTIDFPAEKHTQRIKVTYEDSMVSISNGKLISSKINSDKTRTDIWEQKKPHSIYLSVLVIGNFKVVKDRYKDIELQYYMEPKYESMARPIFGRTAEMIDFFSKKLNYPFPWDKYAQVIIHDYVSGAMENTTVVTFNDFVQKDTRELIDDNDDETIAHELFHHWFGDLATCKSWSDLTLNESFANYSEYLWDEYKMGVDFAQMHWKSDLDNYILSSGRKRESLIRYDYDKPDDMFDVITYNKGGKILHMLRVYLGDEAFFTVLSNYLKKYQFNTAEYSDLRKIAEELTGEDLSWFFNQWYLKGGHPIISTNSIIKDSGVALIVSQKHNFDSTFLYRLPFKNTIYTEEGSFEYDFVLTKKVDTIFVPSKSKVLAVEFDRTNSLVAEKKETKKQPEWAYIFRHAPSYLSQLEALKKIKNNQGKKDVKEAFYEALSSEKRGIVLFALKNIVTDNDSSGRIIKKAEELAKNHKLGKVRAEALSLLNNSEQKDSFRQLFNSKLNDSSYYVEAEAFAAMISIDTMKALEYAKSRTNLKSFAMNGLVFELISKKADSTYFDTFVNLLNESEGFKSMTVGASFGRFIASMPDDKFNKGLALIESIGKRDDGFSDYIANFAFNALSTSLSKLDQVDARVDLVKKKMEEFEKNKRSEKDDED